MNRVAEPGIYYAIPADEYHADCAPEPSLSSGLGWLLLTRTPAHVWHRHPRLNWRFVPKKVDRKADVGSVAHRFLIGRGAELVPIVADSYRTKAAQVARDAAHAAGRIPVLLGDYDLAREIAENARAQVQQLEGCEGAFVHGSGEVVLVWREPSGVWCRTMLDWLMPDRSTWFDLKTTPGSARPDALRTRIYGKAHFQAAFQERGLLTLFPELGGRLTHRLIYQEQEEPHPAVAVELPGAAWAIGRKQVAAAIAIWSRCMAEGIWPGLPHTLQRIEPPPWLEESWLERETREQELLDAGQDPFLTLAPWAPPDTDLEMELMS